MEGIDPNYIEQDIRAKELESAARGNPGPDGSSK